MCGSLSDRSSELTSSHWLSQWVQVKAKAEEEDTVNSMSYNNAWLSCQSLTTRNANLENDHASLKTQFQVKSDKVPSASRASSHASSVRLVDDMLREFEAKGNVSVCPPVSSVDAQRCEGLRLLSPRLSNQIIIFDWKLTCSYIHLHSFVLLYTC